MVYEENMKLRDAVYILIGADIMFNKGVLTNTLLLTFSDFLKKCTKPNTVYVSHEELVDAAFGC